MHWMATIVTGYEHFVTQFTNAKNMSSEKDVIKAINFSSATIPQNKLTSPILLMRGGYRN